ncbi:unnamed protein product [Dovyalis caffra]|uniref:Amidase domain-containing protein n=1 Tax=Dovyalis caffra TaxID=77055 RepID=A0AAV1R890_9ROSI|nr:unnamed protein product [Dovyalis caffra]
MAALRPGKASHMYKPVLMGKKRVMVPAEDVDLSTVKYEPDVIQAPHLTGLTFKLFVKFLEIPVIGPLVISHLKKQNKMVELLQNTVIPEAPMYKPEYPPQETEPGVVIVDEDGKPEERVESALNCLPPYDAASCWNDDLASSFRYWKIRDYSHAYRSKIVTPSMVAERIISAIEDFNVKKTPMPLLISFDAEEVRKQAAASTKRFEEGGTTWMHEVRSVEKDAVCVSRLRSCGVIFVGKSNMHELDMGTTGNNSNYGTTRNPHAVDRYTGGSSSGPAAIVASGLCSAALGTDGGGSIRIPSSLCGVVGLKTTHGRTDLRGSLCDSGTVAIIGPIASSVEDSPPCLPKLSTHDGTDALGSLRLGKYTAWFNDVHSTDVSDKGEDILNLLTKTHGCEMVEIVIPELQEMRTAHVVQIGSEMLNSINPDIEDGKGVRLNYDSRIIVGLFQTFSASDYIATQRLRRRMMCHHMKIFRNVDVLVTPTTGYAILLSKLILLPIVESLSTPNSMLNITG